MPYPSTAIHLRSRSTTGKELQQTITRVTELAPDAILFVNDRVDVAIGMQTTGVHLPESGLEPDEVRNTFGSDLIIGRSTHSVDQARHAVDIGADYVFLGPVWPTSSHPTAPALGLDAIEATRDLCVIAIGGITLERVHACLEAGAHGVAMISAVWNSTHPSEMVRQFLSIITDTNSVTPE